MHHGFIALPLLLLLGTCAAQNSQQQAGLPSTPDSAVIIQDALTGTSYTALPGMVQVDTKAIVEAGHKAMFGSMQNQAKEHKQAEKCMRPIVSLDLPAAEVPRRDPMVGRTHVNSGGIRASVTMAELRLNCDKKLKKMSQDQVASSLTNGFQKEMPFSVTVAPRSGTTSARTACTLHMSWCSLGPSLHR